MCNIKEAQRNLVAQRSAAQTALIERNAVRYALDFARSDPDLTHIEREMATVALRRKHAELIIESDAASNRMFKAYIRLAMLEV